MLWITLDIEQERLREEEKLQILNIYLNNCGKKIEDEKYQKIVASENTAYKLIIYTYKNDVEKINRQMFIY